MVENPLTSSRAVRLALTKAAHDSAGLPLSVSSVAEETGTLDDLLAALPDGLMLVQLQRDGALVGLLALDMQLRAAMVEMATMGTLAAQPADDRPPTLTDKMLCDPLMAGFLAAFPQAVRGTPLEGWGDGVSLDESFANTRVAGLMLPDGRYRQVQMNVQLGTGDRQGLLLMLLPVVETPAVEPLVEADPVDWGQAFGKRVSDAPAALTALLHRFNLPLTAAQSMKVGMVIPLPGCTVTSVRLMAPDGGEIAQAKLGQSGGMRAVRVQAAPLPDLQDLPHQPVADPAVLTVDSAALDQPDTADIALEAAIDDGVVS